MILLGKEACKLLSCSMSGRFRNSKLSADVSSSPKLDFRVAWDWYCFLISGIMPEIVPGTVSEKLASVSPKVFFQKPTLHEPTNTPPAPVAA
jgi:hypothetical protein